MTTTPDSHKEPCAEMKMLLTELEVRTLSYGPRARFSKLPVITAPVELFCFPLQMGVLKGLKIVE